MSDTQIYRCFNVDYDGKTFTITEQSPRNDHPTLWKDDAQTRDMAWAEARAQVAPVIVRTLEGAVLELGVRFRPEVFERVSLMHYLIGRLVTDYEVHGFDMIDLSAWAQALRVNPERLISDTDDDQPQWIKDALPAYIKCLEGAGLR